MLKLYKKNEDTDNVKLKPPIGGSKVSVNK